MTMWKQAATALRACLVTFGLCALAYPITVWGLATLAMPEKASGSLVYARDRTIIGSSLVAQPFATDRYFHPRPSAVDYKAEAAGGSNLGPNSPVLRERVVKAAAALSGTDQTPIPVDLVTTSGSGLDPHISPAAARFQVARVALARKLTIEEVQAVVDSVTDFSASVIGAPPRVNVLVLNLALDDKSSNP